MTQAPSSDEPRFASQEAVGDAMGSELLADLGIRTPAQEPQPEVPASVTEPDSVLEQVAEPEASVEPEQPVQPVSGENVDEWVERVRSNPKAISSVPGPLRMAVTEKLIQSERDARTRFEEEQKEIMLRATRIAIDRGIEQGRQQVLAAQQYQQIEAMATGDPGAFTTWAAANPQLAQWYYQTRSQGGLQALAEAEPVVRGFITAAQTLLATLEPYPELHAAVVQQAQKEQLPQTAEGLQRLTILVSEQRAKAFSSAPVSQPSPPASPQTTLKDVPRPDGVATGGAAPVAATKALPNDLNSLLEMGLKGPLIKAKRDGNRAPQE